VHGDELGVDGLRDVADPTYPVTMGEWGSRSHGRSLPIDSSIGPSSGKTCPPRESCVLAFLSEDGTPKRYSAIALLQSVG
jgi:hypothetical protein